jgi:hypothetical protein
MARFHLQQARSDVQLLLRCCRGQHRLVSRVLRQLDVAQVQHRRHH